MFAEYRIIFEYKNKLYSKIMNYKKVSTYVFLSLSLIVFIGAIILLIMSCRTEQIIEQGQTRTFYRAKSNKIDLGMTKEDFYTETSTLILFNVSKDTFIFVYNENQIKILSRDELEELSDEFLRKRVSPFGEMLLKYIELSRIIFLPILKFEKTMGKLIINNRDYTHDLASYCNFCMSCLAKSDKK
ncbi:hypothetical protein THOM_1451 [Trachipleistophora hominis]|uniref:Uncharacterized protein n=1 Tax=Trachipleistophora hominis TaxID=72359 RepID=L7JVT2_TRAHO|nr:hypothetical protein THOM_1451 [Trachipleistophora hominis]